MAFLEAVKQAYRGWQRERMNLLAAAIAYYAMLSMAPLTILLLGVAQRLFGASARAHLLDAVASLTGEAGVELAESLLGIIRPGEASVLGTVIGVVLILYFSSNVFRHIKGALNTVWQIEKKGAKQALYERAYSLAMVVVAVSIFLASLILSLGTAAFRPLFEPFLPAVGLQLLSQAWSFALTTLVLAALFTAVPDTKVPWRASLIGALVTAALFTLGNVVIGLVISKSIYASLWGAAAALVLVMLWVYYAAMIVIYGARLTKELADPTPSAAPARPAGPG